MNDVVSNLFKEGKLLARAMEQPSLCKNYETSKLSYDFSIWADEYEIAKQEGLGSLSTTLLLPEESIPTYKVIGFLINSDEADVRHVAETDSGSRGNEKDGDFTAAPTDIQSLTELKNRIKSKHGNVMNEVNINMRENAYVGLFSNKTPSQMIIAKILLAQKYYELQAGTVLPIYIYDVKRGELEELDITLEEKANIIEECLKNKKIHSSSIFYETQTGESKSVDYLEEIKKDIEIRDSILQSGIEATKETIRTSSINEQVEMIKRTIKEKKENQKERR